MKKLVLALKIIVSITLIYFVARKINFSHLAGVWTRINVSYLLGAYFLLLLSMVVNSIKWWELLKVQKVDVSLKRVMSHYLVGYFFNNFLTGVGEVKRIYDLSKETGKSHEVVASVFMERWTGIISQVAMALIALTWAYREIPRLHNVLLICGILFVFLLALFLILGRISYIPFMDRFKRIHQWLDTFRESYNEYTRRPRGLLIAFALSIVPPVMLIFIHWILTLGIGCKVSLWAFVLFIPIISVFSQVPVSISGIGVQELLFVQLFGIAGIPAETAFSVSILSHLLKMGVGAIGGIIYLLRKDRKIPKEDESRVCQLEFEKSDKGVGAAIQQ